MKVAVYAVSAIIVAAFQATWLKYISIFGVTPNIMLAFVVCIAIIEEPVTAGVLGLSCGILIDLISPYRFGFNSLMFMYIAVLTSFLKSKYFVASGFVSALFTFFAALVHGLLFYVFFVYLWNPIGFISPLLKEILPSCVYTAFIALLLYPIYRKRVKHG